MLPTPPSGSFHKYPLSTDFTRSALLGGEGVASRQME